MKDTFWVEEYSWKPLLPLKRKRRVGEKKIKFIGWASRPLLEFLEAIGVDTVKKHSQREVSEFITKYVHDKSLVKKNKRVECDEILRALFGRPSVSRTKIYDLLEEHFAENLDDSDDDRLCSSEDENYKERSSKSNFIGNKKKGFESPKSCFSAIISENIKLVYLKKTLIQEFLKVPESFVCKIVGSYVRMKSDPNDIYQNNCFQLQQVTGVKMLSGASDAGNETCLQVSNHFKDVPIFMLSDDNFSEEEMEDLRDRIKAGLLKKITVVELNLKAKMLHEDITKHWIAKELSLLQKLIDHANEKGRRRELFELLERRKQLQKSSELENLLANIPDVIAEELVPDETLAMSSEKAERDSCSPKSALRGSDISSADDSDDRMTKASMRAELKAEMARKMKRAESSTQELAVELSSPHIPKKKASTKKEALGLAPEPILSPQLSEELAEPLKKKEVGSSGSQPLVAQAPEATTHSKGKVKVGEPESSTVVIEEEGDHPGSPYILFLVKSDGSGALKILQYLVSSVDFEILQAASDSSVEQAMALSFMQSLVWVGEHVSRAQRARAVAQDQAKNLDDILGRHGELTW